MNNEKEVVEYTKNNAILAGWTMRKLNKKQKFINLVCSCSGHNA